MATKKTKTPKLNDNQLNLLRAACGLPDTGVTEYDKRTGNSLVKLGLASISAKGVLKAKAKAKAFV